MLSFGVGHSNFSCDIPVLVKIEGKLIIHGSRYHIFPAGTNMIIGETGILEIGDNFGMGYSGSFYIEAHSKIGDNNMHSWQIQYLDTDAHPIFNAEGERINPPKGFEIGDNVWIGSRCSILKGCKIPDGAIIGTGSKVSKQLETPNSIYIGNKLYKENVTWKVK